MATSKVLSKKSIQTTAEQEKALRDQLHIEIENKSKACSNSTYECTIPRIDGYEFCQRHILHDGRAPFKQCAYIYPNNKKCCQAAPKHDTKKDPNLTNFCFEHSRLVQLTKTRNTIGKFKQVETNEALLNQLSHHVTVDKLNLTADLDEEIDVVSPNVEPFVNYDQISNLETVTQAVRNRKRILDYASDSSSDGDVPTLNNTSRVYEWENSDNESVDSQDDDLLKHAGIYTTEEATLITKQKMVKLQSMYVDQITRLQHLLKEKRRKYLQSIRKERETLCSIHDQPKETLQDRRLYEKLKALNHYHRRHGIEAVLHKKFKEKRTKGVDILGNKGPHNLSKCIFTEGGVKCGERILPCAKYCKKHILEDKKQHLFRACGVEKSGVVCQEPVPNIFEDSTCTLHINLPPAPKTYTQKKYESDSEEEDEELSDTLKKDDSLKADDIILASLISVTDDDTVKEETIKEEIVYEPMIIDDRQPDENITISHDAIETKLNDETEIVNVESNENVETEIVNVESNENVETEIVNVESTENVETEIVNVESKENVETEIVNVESKENVETEIVNVESKENVVNTETEVQIDTESTVKNETEANTETISSELKTEIPIQSNSSSSSSSSTIVVPPKGKNENIIFNLVNEEIPSK